MNIKERTGPATPLPTTAEAAWVGPCPGFDEAPTRYWSIGEATLYWWDADGTRHGGLFLAQLESDEQVLEGNGDAPTSLAQARILAAAFAAEYQANGFESATTLLGLTFSIDD